MMLLLSLLVPLAAGFCLSFGGCGEGGHYGRREDLISRLDGNRFYRDDLSSRLYGSRFDDESRFDDGLSSRLYGSRYGYEKGAETENVAPTAIGVGASTTHNSHQSAWTLIEEKRIADYNKEYWMSRNTDKQAQITITLPKVYDVYSISTRGIPNLKYAFEAIHVDAWVNGGWKRVIAEGRGEPVDEKALCSTFGPVDKFYDTSGHDVPFKTELGTWYFRTMDENYEHYKSVKTNKLRITLVRHCPIDEDSFKNQYLHHVAGKVVENTHYALSHIEILRW